MLRNTAMDRRRCHLVVTRCLPVGANHAATNGIASSEKPPAPRRAPPRAGAPGGFELPDCRRLSPSAFGGDERRYDRLRPQPVLRNRPEAVWLMLDPFAETYTKHNLMPIP